MLSPNEKLDGLAFVGTEFEVDLHGSQKRTIHQGLGPISVRLKGRADGGTTAVINALAVGPRPARAVFSTVDPSGGDERQHTYLIVDP